MSSLNKVDNKVPERMALSNILKLLFQIIMASGALHVFQFSECKYFAENWSCMHSYFQIQSTVLQALFQLQVLVKSAQGLVMY